MRQAPVTRRSNDVTIEVWSRGGSIRLWRAATKRGKKEQLLTPTTFSLIHCTDFAHRYEFPLDQYCAIFAD